MDSSVYHLMAASTDPKPSTQGHPPALQLSDNARSWVEAGNQWRAPVAGRLESLWLVIGPRPSWAMAFRGKI